MLLDFHTHIFPDEIKAARENYFHDQGFRSLYLSPGTAIADAEDLIDYLARSGINAAAAMAFPWQDEKNCHNHNEYMAEIAAEYRGKIFPFGMIPRRSRSPILEAEKIKGSELYGVGEIAFYEGMDKESWKYLEKVFEGALSCALPVCLHVNEPLGHEYSGKYYTPFQNLYTLIKKFPGLVLVLSHWGGGILFYELMPEVKEAFENVYYDTAATPYLYSNDIYQTAAQICGSGKIVFGSDFPLLGAERYLDPIRSLSGEERQIGEISGLNAMKILGL